MLHFDSPLCWQIGLPLSLLVLGLAAWRQGRRGLERRRVAVMTASRGVPLLLLVFLCARPVWVAKEPPSAARRPVVLLMDRSESMSLEENDRTRYQHALAFARDYLLPALKSAGLPVQAMVFAQDAEPADGPDVGRLRPCTFDGISKGLKDGSGDIHLLNKFVIVNDEDVCVEPTVGSVVAAGDGEGA